MQQAGECFCVFMYLLGIWIVQYSCAVKENANDLATKPTNVNWLKHAVTCSRDYSTPVKH